MAKDPAFLFYPADASEDTQFMNRLERGCYFDLLKAQKKFHRFSLESIKKVLGADFESCWEALLIVLKKDDTGYFIEWADDAIEKRKVFSESRRTNRSRANNDSLFIYIAKDDATGLYKIGSSTSPERRMIELKRKHPKISLISYFGKTSQTTETEMHKMFSLKQIVNEFYELSDADVEHMKQHMIVHMKLDMFSHMGTHMVNGNENENISINIREGGAGGNQKPHHPFLNNLNVPPEAVGQFVPQAAPTPPTLQAVIEYFHRQNKPEADAKAFFNYHEGLGWKKGVSPIFKWTAFADNWITNPIPSAVATPAKPNDGMSDYDREMAPSRAAYRALMIKKGYIKA